MHCPGLLRFASVGADCSQYRTQPRRDHTAYESDTHLEKIFSHICYGLNWDTLRDVDFFCCCLRKSLFFLNFIYLFIFVCPGSSLLRVDFLCLWSVGHSLVVVCGLLTAVPSLVGAHTPRHQGSPSRCGLQ